MIDPAKERLVPCECVECQCSFLASEDERQGEDELLCDECAEGNHNQADD